MKYLGAHSHRFGEEAIKTRGLLSCVKSLVDAPEVVTGRGSAPEIKAHIAGLLTSGGWAIDVPVAPESDLTLNAIKDRVGLQTQTGNVARMAYDLLKFQAAHQAALVEAGVLIVPSTSTARRMGSNLASFDRLVRELRSFSHIIYVPLLVIEFG